MRNGGRGSEESEENQKRQVVSQMDWDPTQVWFLSLISTIKI